VSHVRYELGFYIPEDGILHSHRQENLSAYVKQLKLRDFSSSRELYRPIGRRLSATLVPTFEVRGVSHSQRSVSARLLISVF
jgi:hypothetical protein